MEDENKFASKEILEMVEGFVLLVEKTYGSQGLIVTKSFAVEKAIDIYLKFVLGSLNKGEKEDDIKIDLSSLGFTQ